tara:strand:+ start:148 stop:630 length:483 start_codon:yes stop_codon:yes gene_type:complete
MISVYELTDGKYTYYGQSKDPDKRLFYHKKDTETSRSRLLDKSKTKMYILHRLYSREEANYVEEFYLMNFKCVNLKITGRTYKQWRKHHKETRGEYCKGIVDNICTQKILCIGKQIYNPDKLNDGVCFDCCEYMEYKKEEQPTRYIKKKKKKKKLVLKIK